MSPHIFNKLWDRNWYQCGISVTDLTVLLFEVRWTSGLWVRKAAASHRMNPWRRSTFQAWHLVPLHILWDCLSVALIHCLQRVWLIPPKPILELIFSIICYTGISGRTCNLLAENGATVMLMLPILHTGKQFKAVDFHIAGKGSCLSWC